MSAAALLFVRYWYFAAIAILFAAVGVQQVRVDDAKEDLSDYKREVSDAQRKQAVLAWQESNRRQQGVDAVAAQARDENARLQADLVRAADTADGLQRDLASFKQRAGARACPAAGSKGQPGPDPLDLLTDLYSRADREAGNLAQFADQLRLAGTACERAYETLTSPSNPGGL